MIELNYGFTDLDSNEEFETNGGIGFTAACLIVVGATMVISAGINAFNGYQEEKRKSRK